MPDVAWWCLSSGRGGSIVWVRLTCPVALAGRREKKDRSEEMAIYEYECGKCGHAFEHLARRLSEPAPKCPSCGASRVRKQFSVFSASAGKQTLPACAGKGEGCSPKTCASGAGPFA